jgi:hypothetical protein
LTTPKFALDWQPLLKAVDEVFRNTANNFAQAGFQPALESLFVLVNSAPEAASQLERLASSGILHNILVLARFAETKYGAEALLGIVLFGHSGPTALPGQAREGVRFLANWKNSPTGSTKANFQIAKALDAPISRLPRTWERDITGPQ